MKPLRSIRVVEFSYYLPGPLTGLILSGLGAEVIKIEQPPHGDPLRLIGADGSGAGGRAFRSLNIGKKSVMIDLKSDAGRQAFKYITKWCDVMLITLRPAAVKKLGVDYETVKETNPSLIYCCLSGYGYEGLLVNKAGHDINYQALSGVLSLCGKAEDGFFFPPIPVCDTMGAMNAALAIVSAIFEKRNKGCDEGCFLDIAMSEAGLIANLFNLSLSDVPGEEFAFRGMLLSGRYPCYNIYMSSDGRLFALGAIEEKFWKRFCQVIERQDLISAQFVPSARDELSREFARRSSHWWCRIAEKEDICLSLVVSKSEIFRNPHFKGRKVFTRCDEAVLKMSIFPFAGQDSSASPSPGQHTIEILKKCGTPNSVINRVCKIPVDI